MECKNGIKMTRAEIIAGVRGYFSTSELVCPHTLAKWGAQSWQFLDTDALHTLLVLREEILQVPLLCNVGKHSQRGLRCNICAIPSGKTLAGKQYLSAHTMGKAFDLSAVDMTAEEMRERIKENADKLPCNIRVEDGVSWLHFDTFDTGERVAFFKV